MWLLVVGLAAMLVAWLPRLLRVRAVSFPIVLVATGAAIFALPLGLQDPDPLRYGEIAERLAEFGVIVALTGAGLKIDRRIGLRSWKHTWLLLGVTMPLTIAGAALLGWGVLGLAPAAAVLFGAAVAPTDPVLASDVQVGEPRSEGEDDVRFALTSEAGLNDGLAFPFTNAAIAMALAQGSDGWVGEWLLVDVLYKVAAGLVIGYVAGKSLAFLVFKVGNHETKLAHSREGLVALAVTLIAYALTQLAGGYGFIAVFVAALAVRDYERDHEYHQELNRFSDQLERLASAVVLILFGGAIVNGLLAPLTMRSFLVALAILLVLRPLSGFAALASSKFQPGERPAIAFFGIRGVGSFYYVAHGLNETGLAQGGQLWSSIGLIVLMSILIHGVTAKPAITKVTEELAEDTG
ncbi:MAG: cation:proton antiporter [Actinomycetota bacterium]|nr:cation:proton antiporter [Actinomycetota bacterium]